MTMSAQIITHLAAIFPPNYSLTQQKHMKTRVDSQPEPDRQGDDIHKIQVRADQSVDPQRHQQRQDEQAKLKADENKISKYQHRDKKQASQGNLQHPQRIILGRMHDIAKQKGLRNRVIALPALRPG